jgi:menaquinone-dependent protoporphyrinogen oxidase
MNKILVTYASRAGSTTEVAQEIAQVLTDTGATVDVKPVKDVRDVSGYTAVVVGSAIRMGNWLPEAVEFVRNHRAQLSQIPTAFFTVHMLNRDNSDESRQAREQYTAQVREILVPNEEIFFSGKMKYARLGFFDRAIAQSVGKATNSEEGDYRDWEAIRAWAQSLQTTLVLA